jgi:hypothetical protein
MRTANTVKKKNPHAVALGRLGGRKGRRTPAQTKAAQENGKKGGRPPKATATE